MFEVKKNYYIILVALAVIVFVFYLIMTEIIKLKESYKTIYNKTNDLDMRNKRLEHDFLNIKSDRVPTDSVRSVYDIPERSIQNIKYGEYNRNDVNSTEIDNQIKIIDEVTETIKVVEPKPEIVEEEQSVSKLNNSDEYSAEIDSEIDLTKIHLLSKEALKNIANELVDKSKKKPNLDRMKKTELVAFIKENHK